MPIVAVAVIAGTLGLVGGFTLSQGVSRAAWLGVALIVVYVLFNKGKG
ncbi:hypothetical protein [Vibrio cionasavignyae]